MILFLFRGNFFSALLTIDGILFEFDTDGSVSNGATPIDFKSLTSVTSKSDALINTLSTALGPNYIINYTPTANASKQTITIEKTIPVLNEKVKISYGTAVPDLKHDPPITTLNPPAAPKIKQIRFKNVNPTTLKDGNTLNINGILFEFDTDGSKNNPSANPINISTSDFASPGKIRDAIIASMKTVGFDTTKILCAVITNEIVFSDRDINTPPNLDSVGFNVPGTALKPISPSSVTNKPGGSSTPREILMLQVGACTQQAIELFIDGASSNSLGVNNVSVNNYNDSTQSIGLVDDAIQQVSSNRSKIGATQNRLEYVLSLNGNYSEQLQSAETRIRDANMAHEVLVKAKENLLSESATQMYNNSIKQTEGILNLLK